MRRTFFSCLASWGGRGEKVRWRLPEYMKCNIDYRKLRLSNLGSEPFRHLKLLLFWPVFGGLFWLVERGGVTSRYYVMHCALDDKIPFCEYFLIPYLFWFVFIVGMHVYTLLYDIGTFKKFMKYIMITYSATILIYFVFPTEQNLRLAAFAHANILTRIIAGFYAFDTNTNVCPSIHVIGALAVLSAAWNSRHFHTAGWRIAFSVTAFLICVSTVFIKQHSVLDILAAIPICLAAYWIVYRKKAAKPKTEEAFSLRP